MSEAISPLFRQYVDGHTVGELPKDTQVAVTPERMRELGYVELQNGEWVHHSEAVRLPQGGTFVWVAR